MSNVNYLRLLVLTIGDVLKEIYQRERQRGRHVRPRTGRSLHYALERALTNVSLRNLTTALVIEEMFNRAPAIYVDYTGYDCLAHHAGPERQEAVDALAGLDRTLRSVLRAAAEAPRDYRIVVLSDHGQCLSTPFSQRFGQGLEEVVRGLMGQATLARLGPPYGEYRGLGRMVLGEIGRGPGIQRAVARRAARRRRARGQPVEVGDLVVCASGNLALIYLTCSDQRMSRDELDERYPALIAGLVDHPGVELVLVHSATVGPQVLSRTGELDLRSGRFSGLDPLEPFGPRARASLQRLDGFSNTGDVVLIGPFEPSTGEVVSYE
ncbi:MAG: alkaline phosphatase family protein, partial [Candidatus Limnocylindrales bacterium]